MEILELAAKTDVGKQRQDNQDTFTCMKLWTNDQALIAVIDGVGGYEGGDVAAASAKASIEQYMATPKGDAFSMLKEAVVIANNQIFEDRAKDPKLAQMCCVLTVVVADAQNHTLYYVHVGDTRLYRLRDGQIEKITKDHSLVGVREDEGELTEEEAMQHPRRNVILRQVGSEPHRIDDPEFLDYGTTDFLPGDTVLICSDGLSDMITRAQMISVLEKQISFPAKVTDLIALANDMGGKDNITVVLAKNRSKQKPAVTRKKTTLPASEISGEIVEEPAKQPKKSSKSMIIGGIVIAAVIAILIWWFTKKGAPEETNKQVATPANTTTSNPSNTVTVPVRADENGKGSNETSKKTAVPAPAFNIDSLMNRTMESKGKELLLELLTGLDTIRLDKPIQLSKIQHATGGNTKRKILIPATGSGNTTAFELVHDNGNASKTDTFFLKNILIKGFETGIRAKGKTIIRLQNVLFDEVKHPVSYEAGIDTIKVKQLSFQ